MQLVFISGMFAGGWIWEQIIDQVPTNYDIYVQEEALSEISGKIADLEARIQRIVDNYSYRYGGQSILVANSLGGLIAVQLAMKNPDKIPAIILSGAPGMGDVNLGIGLPGEDKWFYDLRKKLFVDEEVISDDQLNRVKLCFNNRKTFKNIVKLSRYSRKFDIRGLLDQIDQNILFLWGSHDEVAPVDDWYLYSLNRDNIQMDIIDECGHSPMLEKPVDFISSVISFLKEVNYEKNKSIYRIR